MKLNRWMKSMRRRFVKELRSESPWSLSHPLLQFNNRDIWTIGDACQGTLIFGGTGSGKTSGSLANIVIAFLRAGFGGLFLTCKSDDASNYLRLCHQEGREDDVILFGANGSFRFNPLDAELRRRDAGAGLTQNVVTMLSTLLEVSERNQSNGQGEDTGYWRRANRQLCFNAIELLTIALDRITVPDLYRLVISAPNSLEQVGKDSWKQSSYCFHCLGEADRRHKSVSKKRDFELVADFFLVEWPNLSDRTRSVVLSTFTSMLDVMNRGLIRDLMSGDVSNVSPEMAQDGKIIIVDLATMIYGEVGVFAQVLWKFCLQRAQERRDTSGNPRPVFIVSDESHLLAVKQDQIFQTTARSSRTAVVYATQSISNYFAALGHNAEAEVHSLLGCLQTQVFHQQADIKTNAYASELIGRTRQFMVNAGHSYTQEDTMGKMFGNRSGQTSGGVNECFEFDVQPGLFSRLRKGGPPHWVVDSIVYQGGRRFSSTGKSWAKVTFEQQLGNNDHKRS